MNAVTIIGGGPSGLSAAIYLARAGFSPLVIEGMPPGGQLTETTDVENYPGFPDGILGPDLISRFRAQAERFGTTFLTQNVTAIKKTDDSLITVVEDQVIDSRSILIATGAQALWLGLPSEERLRGKGVSACATCDGFFFRGKTVAVVGGGDTAMEEALTLSKFASKLYLIHRRDTFRASKIMEERVRNNPKIELILSDEIVEVMGREKVEGVRLKSGKHYEVQGLFVAIGHRPATGFLKGSGVVTDEKGYITVDNYATSIKGIFAAGDCVDHRYRQAATAVGMGVAASLEIQWYLASYEKHA